MSHDSAGTGATDDTDTADDADREIHLPVAAQESVGAIVEIAQRSEHVGYERA